MKKLQPCILILLMLVLTSLLGACAQTPAPGSTSTPIATPTSSISSPTPKSTLTPTSESPQYGGVLKIITTGAAVNLGYPTTPVPYWPYGRPCVESLVGYDEKGAVIPWLATAWQISPDFNSITFTLRKGVRFQDGTDFNAEAAKYNLDLTRTSVLPDLKSVASVDVIDDYTIRLNLSSYSPAYLSELHLINVGIEGLSRSNVGQPISAHWACLVLSHPIFRLYCT